jgi:type IV/VI secretion system ImpK/VasF family protein
MTLLDIYEDLFACLCRLNRASKAPTHPNYDRVRSDILELLQKAAQNAGSDVRLLNQVRALELPMIFFVDNMICTSRLNFAPQWADNRLAVKLKNELAGDERWFEFLENDLHDSSEEARERLAVYYTCLGLGFTGMYVAQPEKLNGYINQIYPLISPFMNRNPASKLTEEAYKYTNTTVLTEPPGKMLVVVTVVFIFLALSTVAVYCVLYYNASEDVSRYIDQTVTNNLPVVPK